MNKYECPNCFGIVMDESNQDIIECSWCLEPFKKDSAKKLNNVEIDKEELEEEKEEESKSRTIDFSSMESFSDGQYLVGNDIKAGEYLLIASNYERGYFCISEDPNDDNILENGASMTYAYISVKNGEFLKLSNATIYNVHDNDLDKICLNFSDNTQGIMYRVGIDLAPGTYKVSTNKQDGYYSIYDKALSSDSEIVNNECFSGTVYLRVSSGEYLLLTGGTYLI